MYGNRLIHLLAAEGNEILKKQIDVELSLQQIYTEISEDVRF